MPAPQRAVVFDFGAVLFRWQPLVLLQQVLPAHAPDEPAARHLADALFQGFQPDGDWAGFDRGGCTAAALAAALATRTGLPATELRRFIDAIPPHLQLQAPTLALVHRLRAAGHRLHFLSNMPLPYADALEAAHPLAEWFDGGVFSARVGMVKPEPAIFLHTAERFGLAPQRTLFIDDHQPNIETARSLGWQALQFSDAGACEAELRARGWL